MSGSRIVVLGAGGFIGRRIVEDLSKDPRYVPIAAVRPGSHHTFAPSTEVVTLDATNTLELSKVIEGGAGIVNCVAGNSATIINGAGAIARAVQVAQHVPRVVQLSSLAVYGSATGTVDESSETLGDVDGYGAAKVVAERTLQASCKSLVILRPGIVYGPGSPLWSRYIGRLLQTGRLGTLGAGGDGFCNLVYVDDVVRAVRNSLELPIVVDSVFNLSSSDELTWNGYFSAYALALGLPALKPMSRLRLSFEIRCLSPALKIAELLLGSNGRLLPPAIRPWFLARCRHRIRMDVTLAGSALDMTWQPLESGLNTTAKWFRDFV